MFHEIRTIDFILANCDSIVRIELISLRPLRHRYTMQFVLQFGILLRHKSLYRHMAKQSERVPSFFLDAAKPFYDVLRVSPLVYVQN